MKFCKQILILCFFVIAMQADAQSLLGQTNASSSTFNNLAWIFAQSIGAGDQSISYLASLFGSVGGLLPGNQFSLVSNMIHLLNFGILLFLAGIITFSTSMHVIKTANQGTLMGKQVGSSTTFIRITTAVSLAVPLPGFGGYCTLQIFIIHLVIQGIGVADFVWNKTADMLNESGSIFPSYLQSGSATGSDQQSKITREQNNLTQIVNLSKGMINSQLCYFANKKQFDKDQAAERAKKKAAGTAQIDVTTGTSHLVYQEPTLDNPGSISYNFPVVGTAKYKKCGTINIGGFIQKEQDYLSNLTKNEKLQIQLDRYHALVGYYNSILGISSEIYDQAYSDWEDLGKCQYTAKTDKSSEILNCYWAPTINSNAQILLLALQESARMTFTALKDKGAIKVDATSNFSSVGGWIIAGANYSRLVQSSPPRQDSPEKQFDSFFILGKNPAGISVPTDLSEKVKDTYLATLASYKAYSKAVLLNQSGHADINTACSKCVSFRIAARHVGIFKSQADAAAGKYGTATDIMMDSTALNEFQDDLWAAVHNIMPEGTGANKISADRTQAALQLGVTKFQVKARSYNAWDVLGCAGVVPTAFIKGWTSSKCPDGQGNTWSTAIGSFLNIGDPAQNFFSDKGFGYDVSSRSTFIIQDIQMFMLDMYEAWVKMIFEKSTLTGDIATSPDDTESDPLANLQNFGIATVAAGYTFIVRMVQDTWFANYSAVLNSFGLAQSYGMAAMGMKMGATAANKAADFIPFFGWIARIAAAALNVGATYETAMSKTPVLFYPLVVASKTMYVGISIFASIPLILLGTLFATYIPMLPFLVFTFTVIGWFMTVIEAVIAGPIVAAGIASPQGHDFLGRAQQIGMMLAGVFVRPVCILIGFFMAIFTFLIAMKLLNGLFSSFFLGMINQTVTSAKLAPSASGVVTGNKGNSVSILLMMYIYGLIVFSLVRYIFSMVHIIPSYIVRWIGIRPMTGGEQEAIQGVESGMKDEIFGRGLQGAASGVEAQKNPINFGG